MWEKISKIFDPNTPYAWMNIIIGGFISLIIAWSLSMLILERVSWTLIGAVGGMLWIPIIYGELFATKKDESEAKPVKKKKNKHK